MRIAPRSETQAFTAWGRTLTEPPDLLDIHAEFRSYGVQPVPTTKDAWYDVRRFFSRVSPRWQAFPLGDHHLAYAPPKRSFGRTPPETPLVGQRGSRHHCVRWRSMGPSGMGPTRQHPPTARQRDHPIRSARLAAFSACLPSARSYSPRNAAASWTSKPTWKRSGKRPGKTLNTSSARRIADKAIKSNTP